MAKQSLEHFSSSLNISLDTYDLLSESLAKLHALSYMALSDHFALANEAIIHNYMGLLVDLTEEARDAFDEIWKIKKNKQQI